jgi:hypothetical protein
MGGTRGEKPWAWLGIVEVNRNCTDLIDVKKKIKIFCIKK